MLIFFFFFAIVFPAWAERPLPPRAGAFAVNADISHFTTTSNYNSGGSGASLPSGGELKSSTLSLGLSYDFSRNLRAFTTLALAQTQTSSPNPGAPGETLSRSHSGVNEAHTGVLAWWHAGWLALAPTAGLIYPFWRVDESSESPLLGEGALRARAGVWLIGRTAPVQPFVFGGYEHRDGGRSSLVPYSAGLHIQHKIWWAQAEYRGSASASGDSDGDAPVERLQYLTNVQGGSFRFYSIEPSTAEAALETGLRFDGWSLHAGFSSTVSGKSAAQGQTFYAGVAFAMKTSAQDAPSAAPSPGGAESEGFEAVKDRYDESLFREKPQPAPERKIRKKVRKGPSVEKQMHETEKSLQGQD